MKSWSIGGIIGGIVALFLVILYNFSIFNFLDFFLFPFSVWNTSLFWGALDGYPELNLLETVIFILFYFIVGSFIGWIVGKFKNKISIEQISSKSSKVRQRGKR